MNPKKSTNPIILFIMLLTVVIGFSAATAYAKKPVPPPTLPTDLADLVTEGTAVDDQLSGISLTQDNSCTELGTANTSVGDYLSSIETVLASITAPLTLDTASLTSLDELSNLAVSMAGSARNLSLDVNTISGAADLVEYQASLAAMLRLSDDIGTMADRILEMANMILLMADNIGLMADRILITQQLQSSNVVLTQASILATQQNIVTLSSTLDTLGFNTALAGLVNSATLLSAEMTGVTLTETNMAIELSLIESSTTNYLNSVVALYTQMSQASAGASFYINGDTLLILGDLSGIHAALAQSLEGFAQAVNTLSPLTATPILSDATASMLRLATDIGIMSDRIMEMVDNIIIMADNIGDMSDQIVETQNIQQTNITTTQNSLVSAQSITVTVISSQGL